MKNVHHLAIIAQPAFIEGLTTTCPHCDQDAMVREDGSAFCVSGNLSFAPEPSDGELFNMRRLFDARNGIELKHRFVMVPSVIAQHDAART